jgi:succinoglycan biosynthesis transport protein ExoP
MRSIFLRVTGQANRRRLVVFAGTLVVALAASLAFTWLRVPVYRAVARVEITPGVGSVIVAPAPVNATEAQRPFLTEVQVLASRPVLEDAAQRLKASGYDLAAFGTDPVAGMESHLEALPVADTNVVEVAATGQHPEVLAAAVNAVIAAYQDRLSQAFRKSSGEALANADEEVQKLEQSVTAKRREVEAFRVRNSIVSLERDENEVLARVRNLSTSMATANDRAAAAEGKLHALEAAAAGGRTAVRARDDPTLASLEQRASQIREELRDLERDFTPDYMAKDPKVIAQRARLAELERQITVQRKASQQTALLEAQEDVAATRGAVARIQSQMGTARQEATQFTLRFNEYKARQDELADLEKASREAVQRRARLEATEQARMPTTRVLEAASAPREPWRPLYWRDTAISIGGSLLLALLAMWLVELFNRTEPQPAVVLIQPQAANLSFQAPQALADIQRPAAALEAVEPTLLPQQPRFPRELRAEEVAALVRAADGETRLAILLLLSGVALEEALALRWSEVDAEHGIVRVGEGSAREVVAGGALRACLREKRRNDGELLLATQGRPLTRDSVDAQILCAAHDAGIEAAAGVDSAVLRHTYVAFLVRQGIRFADLTRVVGSLPAEVIRAYSTLSPPGTRSELVRIRLPYPGLEEPL